MKKNYPLRIDKNIYDSIEKIAEEQERSVNFIINKLLKKSLDIEIDDNVIKDLETYSKKYKMTVSQLIDQMLKAYSKTYKR